MVSSTASVRRERAVVQRGLGAFLDSWPQRGALTASPALAALDPTGRLRPRRDAMPAPFIPQAPRAPAAALLGLVIGAPCVLLASRAGAPVGQGVEAFMARYLARTGRVRLSHERMDVILRAEDIDLDIRRAGLDRDPGWLPWMRRTVHFLFEELSRETAHEVTIEADRYAPRTREIID